MDEDEELVSLKCPQNILLEISSKGNQRLITFKSQLELVNNIEYPITLEFRYIKTTKTVV